MTLLISSRWQKCRKNCEKAAFFALFAVVLGGLLSTPAQAARVPATKLLPKKTLFYARVASVPQMVTAFRETNFGRLLADPQIKPLVGDLYGAAGDAVAEFGEQIGLSLDDLLKMPQGEITLALVATETAPAFITLLDCGDNIASARTLLAKLRERAEQGGTMPTTEIIDGVTVTIYETGNRRRREFTVLERDNAIAITTTLDAAKMVLARWTEGSDDCLAENPQFGTIMNKCQGTKDEPPHISFFLDPITAAYEFTKGNTGAQVALAILPTLGVDGLKGIGGSVTLTTEDYDLVTHVHVLLDNPRAGLMELIAMNSGDNTPPAWVPASVASYTSLNWNFDETFTKGVKLADSFGLIGGGNAAGMVNDRVEQELGINFQNDLLPQMSGRVLAVSWFEKDAKLGVGPANLVGVQMKDAAALGTILEKVTGKLGDRLEKTTLAGMPAYRQVVDLGPDEVRPVPCFAQLDEWLLIADRPTMLEHVLQHRNDTEGSLAKALDYKLIASKIARQPGGDKPAMIGFNRPDQGMRYMYDLAASDQTRTMLRDGSENNRFLRVLNEGLDKNPLPPYAVMERYFAPGGSMIVDDETGIHYLGFSLRRK